MKPYGYIHTRGYRTRIYRVHFCVFLGRESVTTQKVEIKMSSLSTLSCCDIQRISEKLIIFFSFFHPPPPAPPHAQRKPRQATCAVQCLPTYSYPSRDRWSRYCGNHPWTLASFCISRGASCRAFTPENRFWSLVSCAPL